MPPAIEAGPDWGLLSAHVRRLARASIRELFAEHPERVDEFTVETAGLYLDASRNRIDSGAFAAVLELARQARLEERIRALFAGETVNVTEKRPALHWLFRDFKRDAFEFDGTDLMPGIRRTLERMDGFCSALRTGAWRSAAGLRITDVVNVGIGGSDWGPRLVTRALAAGASEAPRVHFLANVDGHRVSRLMRELNPDTTLCIVTSKSFKTPETLLNTRELAQWLGERRLPRQLVAVTANPDAARHAGVTADNIFQLWSWIGGRFSLWSPAGLAAGVALGMDTFREVLAGGAAMDAHFLGTPLQANMPVMLGLLDVWQRNGLGCPSRAIVPYDERLADVVPWLQQLVMESTGKSVTEAGTPVAVDTAPVVWGGTGTPAQHTFMQAVHQGTADIPLDLVVVAQPDHDLDAHRRLLVASLAGQAAALTGGEAAGDPHRRVPGNRSANVLVLERLSPSVLGAFLALQEHRAFVTGVLWGIDPFDQFGVELGKRLAGRVLEGQLEDLDPSLRKLLERLDRE